MDRIELMEMFNKQPRIGVLSTSDSKGNVNVAVFGSPQMIDENTVVMGIGNNRSLKYLRENPEAAFIVMEPGATLADWKGVRVYLEVYALEEKGDFFDTIVAGISRVAGETAAKMIIAAVRFHVSEVRPIVDVGDH